MQGHVRRRGKSWAFWLDVGKVLAQRCEDCGARRWCDQGRATHCDRCGGLLGPSAPERRQVARSGFRTQKEALTGLRAMQRLVDDGGDPFPADLTVGEWFERWFDSATFASLRPATRRGYREHANHYILPVIGSMQLSAVRRRHVIGVLDRAAKQPKAGKPVSMSTIRAIRVAMSSCFTRAVDAELIDVNPVTGVRLPRPERQDLEVPDAAEVRKLIEVANGTPWAIPVLLSSTTGARRSEVLGLQWENVDLDAGRATISVGLQRVRDDEDGGSSSLQLLGVKTDRSHRTIKLPSFVVARLRSWRKAQNERRLKLGEAWPADLDLVCDRGDGRPLDPDAYSHAVKRLLVDAGLSPDTRLHDLRHAVATLLLEAGHDTAVASAVLGHSSPAFTATTYQHVRARLTDAAADSIDDALG